MNGYSNQGCMDCGSDKFRQLPCRTFISVGNCPYRDRCVYLHDPRISSKLAKSSTRRKNKDETSTDLFYWPTMNRPVSGGRHDSQRRPHVVQAYSVDLSDTSTFPITAQLAVHSMWEHFVDSCRGTSSMNASQERSVHSGRKRLPMFISLASGKGTFNPRAESFVPVAAMKKYVSTPPHSPLREGVKARVNTDSPISIITPTSDLMLPRGRSEAAH